jgi:hypothetical protein
VLQYVGLNNLFASRPYKLILPRDGEALAQFAQSPAIALVRKPGSLFLLVGFDVMESNWPFEPSFVMFCYNATAYLGMELDPSQETSLHAGTPITAAGNVPQSVAKMDGPGFKDRSITADPSGTFRFGATDRAGLYTLKAESRPPMNFALNLLDEQESCIEPQRQVVLSGQSVPAKDVKDRLANLELWPYLVALVLALACAEWLVYNSKARI